MLGHTCFLNTDTALRCRLFKNAWPFVTTTYESVERNHLFEKKQIGKKNSTRKRSNAIKVPVTQIIDILEQNSFTTKNKVPQSNMTDMVNLSQMSGIILSPELNAPANQGWYNQQIVSTPSVLPYQGFALKWVNGTTVTRCYQCGMEIPNPLKIPLEDLVIVLRDYREYRHRWSNSV